MLTTDQRQVFAALGRNPHPGERHHAVGHHAQRCPAPCSTRSWAIGPISSTIRCRGPGILRRPGPRIRTRQPGCRASGQFEALTVLAAGAYFLSPAVKAAMPYDAAPRPARDDMDDYIDMLEHVVDRGFDDPLIRPEHQQGNQRHESNRSPVNGIHLLDRGEHHPAGAAGSAPRPQPGHVHHLVRHQHHDPGHRHRCVGDHAVRSAGVVGRAGDRPRQPVRRHLHGPALGPGPDSRRSPDGADQRAIRVLGCGAHRGRRGLHVHRLLHLDSGVRWRVIGLGVAVPRRQGRRSDSGGRQFGRDDLGLHTDPCLRANHDLGVRDHACPRLRLGVRRSPGAGRLLPRQRCQLGRLPRHLRGRRRCGRSPMPLTFPTTRGICPRRPVRSRRSG